MQPVPHLQISSFLKEKPSLNPEHLPVYFDRKAIPHQDEMQFKKRPESLYNINFIFMCIKINSGKDKESRKDRLKQVKNSLFFMSFSLFNAISSLSIDESPAILFYFIMDPFWKILKNTWKTYTFSKIYILTMYLRFVLLSESIYIQHKWDFVN